MKQITKPRFNTISSLETIIPPSKVATLHLPQLHTVFIGSKDGGRSFLVNCKEIQTMERDPHANCLALKKHVKSASKRLGSDLNKNIINLSRQFHFPYKYHLSQSNFYRETSKHTPEKQFVEFSSFEDIAQLAGITCSNGGYFSIVHIEEPIEIDDSPLKIPSPAQWKQQIKIIQDSVSRSVRDYLDTNPKYPPLPTRYYYTMNNWEPLHPIAIQLERYSPERDWIKLITGFYPKQLLGNKQFVIDNWTTIEYNLLHNTFHSVSIDYDPITDEKIDTNFVRSTKFWNPKILSNLPEKIEVLRAIRYALITNDRSELARLIGTQDLPPSRSSFAYNIPLWPTVFTDTKKLIASLLKKNYTFLHTFVAWDIDPAKRFVGTLTFLMAKPIYSFDGSIYEYKDYKAITVPQISVSAPDRIDKSTRLNFKSFKNNYINIASATTTLISNWITNPQLRNCLSFNILIDDNWGAYAGGINDILEKTYPTMRIMTCASIKKMKFFEIINRPELLEKSVLYNFIAIDHANTDLMSAIYNLPKDENGKRYEKGRFNSTMDNINSYEYSLYFFYNMMNTLIYNLHKDNS